MIGVNCNSVRAASNGIRIVKPVIQIIRNLRSTPLSSAAESLNSFSSPKPLLIL